MGAKPSWLSAIKRKQPPIPGFILTVATMDFESAMQTFAEAWMAANRSGLVLGENPNKNSKSSQILPEDSKATDEEKVSDLIICLFF